MAAQRSTSGRPRSRQDWQPSPSCSTHVFTVGGVVPPRPPLHTLLLGAVVLLRPLPLPLQVRPRPAGAAGMEGEAGGCRARGDCDGAGTLLCAPAVRHGGSALPDGGRRGRAAAGPRHRSCVTHAATRRLRVRSCCTVGSQQSQHWRQHQRRMKRSSADASLTSRPTCRQLEKRRCRQFATSTTIVVVDGRWWQRLIVHAGVLGQSVAGSCGVHSHPRTTHSPPACPAQRSPAAAPAGGSPPACRAPPHASSRQPASNKGRWQQAVNAQVPAAACRGSGAERRRAVQYCAWSRSRVYHGFRYIPMCS